jgi:hypothetical protein
MLCYIQNAVIFCPSHEMSKPYLATILKAGVIFILSYINTTKLFYFGIHVLPATFCPPLKLRPGFLTPYVVHSLFKAGSHGKIYNILHIIYYFCSSS